MSPADRPDPIEGLLRERGERLGLDPLTEAGAERIRMRIADERERLRRRRVTRAVAALAAAAAIVATWSVWPGRPAGHRPLELELALLDDAGRELEGAERRGPGDPLAPPDAVLLEVLPASAGVVQVLVYDPRGARADDAGVAPTEVAAGDPRTWSFAWTDEPLPEGGPASAALVLIGSLRAIAASDVDAHWPDTLEHASGAERYAELEALAAAFERALGCTVVVSNVPLGGE